jgi:hypothetical protein
LGGCWLIPVRRRLKRNPWSCARLDAAEPRDEATMHGTTAVERETVAPTVTSKESSPPLATVANGSYLEANHGTRFRYSGKFILCSSVL